MKRLNIHCCVPPQRCPKQQKLIQQLNSINYCGTELFSRTGPVVRARRRFVYFQSSKKNYMYTRRTSWCRSISENALPNYVRELFWSDSNQWSQTVAKFNGPHMIFTIELMYGAIVSQIKHKPNLVLSPSKLHIIFMHMWWNRTVVCRM